MARLNVFDGIRGVAAIMVVFSHSVLMFSPWLHNGVGLPSVYDNVIFNFPFKFFYNGSAAVGVFFVLSGMVLSFGCFSNNMDCNYMRDAALKRYIRLGIPVFFAVLISFFMMKFGLFSLNVEVAKSLPLASDFIFSPSLYSAIFDGVFGAIFLGGTSYNYVLWTISVEFFGSLMVYSTLALFGRDRNILRFVSLFAFMFLSFYKNDFSIFYGLFMAGVFISTFDLNTKSTLVTKITSLVILSFGLYLMGYVYGSRSFEQVASLLVYLERSGVHISWMLPLGLGAIMVIVSVFIDNSILAFLSRKPFQFIGKMSFSMYLLHPLTLAVVGPYVYFFTGRTLVGAVVTFVSVSIITLLFSVIFYFLFDREAIRLSSEFSLFINGLKKNTNFIRSERA